MTATVVLVGLALATFGLKATVPLVLGGRPLPETFARFADLVPAALLAALVVASTLARDGSLAIDARLAGVGAAALALLLRAPFVVVVMAAAATTALVRLV